MQDFTAEMQRILPADVVKNTILQDNYWEFLITLISDYCEQITKELV